MSLLSTLDFISNHPLNRGNRLNALGRYVGWQIGSRIVPGDIAYKWVNDTRLLARSGDTGVTGNIYCGLQEFHDMGYILHAATEDDFFVDVGANVGSYTVLACGAKGARGCCFEPVPSTYERLVRNINLNNLSSRVSAFNLGLADKRTELVFSAGENCTNHVMTGSEYSGETVTVKVLTLDEALENLNPTILKIDVEGFESPVIMGAQRILQNPSLHSIVMELNGSGNRYGFDENKLFSILLGYGFAAYSYEPFSRHLSPLNSKNSLSGNTLFVRNLDSVRKKLAAAPRIKINEIEI